MSIIFGLREPIGKAAEHLQLSHWATITNRYAPDGTFVYVNGRIGMGYQPYHTHERSRLDSQPAIDSHGNVVALDGRLDNHSSLCRLLDIQKHTVTDSGIVLAAFERWGEDCFSRFIGDWAIALWSSRDQYLYLARDHAGTRTLYFEQSGGSVRWSTYVETFFTGARKHVWDERYIACYLMCQPIRDLTPYAGIQSVPPAHYIVFHENQCRSVKHWQGTVAPEIRYQTDAEYEEHFLSLFRQSIERRTRTGEPVIAQLSGGMDSSSLVCMSDHIRREQGVLPEELIDTVSYYDDSEPNWDEKPYFTSVEARRGKRGVHIAVSLMDWPLTPGDPVRGVSMFPGTDGFASKREADFNAAIAGKNYRAILSGIGGDELLGGVPNAYPELANYVFSGDLRRFLVRTAEWCTATRTPFVDMLRGTLRFASSLYIQPSIARKALPPWINSELKTICLDVHENRRRRDRRLGLSPLRLSNEMVWRSVLETLPHLAPEALSRLEFRYPYLDRDLVQFLFAIPREQLVRPGRRRSLMRRALKALVPPEVLERRRKAFIVRGPIALIREREKAIADIVSRSWAIETGLVNLEPLKSGLDVVRRGQNLDWWPSLMRLFALELWIRSNPNTLALRPPDGLRLHRSCFRAVEHTTSVLAGQDIALTSTEIEQKRGLSS